MAITKYFRMADLATKDATPGILPVKEATIRKWIREGHFPKPVYLGPGTAAWSEETINQWLASKEVN